MRTARGAAQRARSLGAPLNLTQNTQTCPPGYHWESPAIHGLGAAERLRSSIGACVSNVATLTPAQRQALLAWGASLTPPPAAPAAPRVINFRLPPPAAPAPAAPRVVAFHLGPTPAPAAPFTSDAVAEPVGPAEPAPAAAPACDCWPWWWMLVAAAVGAGASVALTGKDGKKRRQNAERYVVRHVVRRLNPIALLGL